MTMQFTSSWRLLVFLLAEIRSRNRDQRRKIAMKVSQHIWRCTRKPGITMAKVNKQWKLWQTGSFQTVSRNGIQFSTWSIWVFVWGCSIPFQMGFCVTSDSWHAGLHVYITNLPPLHPCWMDLPALSQWRIANTPSTTSNIAGRCPAYIYCIWSPIWERVNTNYDTVEKYMYIFKTRQISIFSGFLTWSAALSLTLSLCHPHSRVLWTSILFILS